MQAERTYTATEKRIFRAAISVFGERGKHGARVRDIAQRAGTNKALVHYYFRSKERLYSEVFRYLITTMFRFIAQAVKESDDFADIIRTFIDRYFSLLEKNRDILRFMFREILAGATAFGKELEQIYTTDQRTPPHIFFESYERAVRRGEIRDIGAVQTLLTMIGACVLSFMAPPIVFALYPMERKTRKQFMNERKEHIFNILYFGLQPRVESPA
ncbi:MAG: TetR family transcriptional regulator [Bacteroidota bacterium]|nr:TetR family transcriptional regulator [Bacteroidota bacterium]